jgi:hypothetical protein
LGLQGLQPRLAAQGLQPRFLAAHGFFAAQGLQPRFLAAHGLQPRFLAAHGLHDASWIGVSAESDVAAAGKVAALPSATAAPTARAVRFINLDLFDTILSSPVRVLRGALMAPGAPGATGQTRGPPIRSMAKRCKRRIKMV